MIDGLLAKYDGRVPRYTSYPTAPHFHPGVTANDYRGWLRMLDPTAPVSLYLHVPFCTELCWYCGCNTKVARRREPLADYVTLLMREIDLVADAIGRRTKVSHIHLGGGTPNALEPDDIATLFKALRARFDVAPDAEIAAEIDPRTVTEAWIQSAAVNGLTRASLGVQDFDPEVQKAIHRIQPYERTEDAVRWLRGAGVSGINLDLMYGLPYQTTASVLRTLDRALALEPDRLALFGYAHVPWMKPHQRLLPEHALPGTAERCNQQVAAAGRLVANGYTRIGLDHYARPHDALARAGERMRRNFQGYTTDTTSALIGLGSSSIGRLSQGYVQNQPNVTEWRDALRAGALPIARGHRLNSDDRLRAAVIERLMCDFAVDLAVVTAEHGWTAAALDDEVAALGEHVADGLVRLHGRQVMVTEAGRPFVRSVCATFDRYLHPGKERHGPAI